MISKLMVHVRRRALMITATTAVTAFGLAGTAAAAPVADPERDSNDLTGWTFQDGVSAAAILSADAAGQRAYDIELTGASTFATVTVSNSGTYARGTRFVWVDRTAAQLASLISSNNARLLDLESRIVSGTRLFSATAIANTGDAAKTWFYYVDVTPAQIATFLGQNNARLTDLDETTPGKYNVIMIRNTGVDARGWFYYFNQTPAEITSRLSTNAARLTHIEPSSTAGRFHVVMTKDTRRWFWYHGKTLGELAELSKQNGARVYDLERYTVGTATRYAALMLGNSNAETNRLRDLAAPRFTNGRFGFYIKQVNGAVAAGIKQDDVFEPASAIKVVPHLYATRRMETGTASLTDSMTVRTRFSTPPSSSAVDKDICPSDATAPFTYQQPLSKVDGDMMAISSNPFTRAVIDRFGRANINGFADGNGYTKTVIRQILGCGYDNGLRNDWTLVDGGRLYEQVVNGEVLSTPTWRNRFWSVMNGFAVGSAFSTFRTMVNEEAAKQGKSAIASQFANLMEARNKGGGYGIACSKDPGRCPSGDTAGLHIRSLVGRVTVPTRTGGVAGTRTYVHGYWHDAVTGGTSGGSSTQADAAFNQLSVEIYREPIRLALQTWPAG